jgi:tetratricopeptide (TPR) repeat protein
MNKPCKCHSLTLLLLSLFITPAIPALAAKPATTQTIPGLGTATFPTSTHSPEAQTAFMRGLLLLHVFEYEDAAKAFQTAEKLDPTFAMAYWGEAMTYNHPVWNQVDVAAGQAALRKLAPTPEARAAAIVDPRQRAYMATVEILYDGNGTKPERDAQYATAMQKLAQTYPADDEAQLFYSLALLGRSEGVRNVPVYLQAAAIAKAVFARNPNHPGAAHYWIHGMDDPAHAAGALTAARALSKIAPDAGHAQHMCSHIFMALGMWDDVVKANVNAMRVVDEHDRATGQPVIDCGHYATWLQYGYYQQGRTRDGDRMLAECQRTGAEAVAWTRTQPGDAVAMAKKAQARAAETNASVVRMRGIAIIESRDWSGRAATMTIDQAGLSPSSRIWDAFATGYAAAERGDREMAASSLASLRKMAAEEGKKEDPDSEEAGYQSIIADELSGLISSKAGDMDGAITEVRRGAATYGAMAFDFGPPVTVKPPNELLGELLLKQKKFPQAREAFETSLKRAPLRAQSLLGLARAQSAAGDKTAATATYGQLLAISKHTDAGNRDVVEARRYVAATERPNADLHP